MGNTTPFRCNIPDVTDTLMRAVTRPPDILALRSMGLQPAPSITAPNSGASDIPRDQGGDYPPWIHPPFGALPLDEPQNVLMQQIAALGTLTITLPRVPPGRILIIKKIGVDTTDVDNTRITTRIDGTAVPPFSGRFGALGSVQTPYELAAAIQVPPNATFSLTLDNIQIGAALSAAGRIAGWYY